MGRKPLLLAFVLLLVVILQPYGLADEPLPGSKDDPLVTRSYLEGYLQSTLGPLQEKLTALEKQVAEVERRVEELRRRAKIKVRLTLGQARAFVGDREYTLDVPPFLSNGRTMLPFRFLGEALGAEVGWEAASMTVSYRLEGTEVLLSIDSPVARKNGVTVALDAPPRLEKERTVVPVRLVSELLGAAVEWDEKTQVVTVTR